MRKAGCESRRVKRRRTESSDEMTRAIAAQARSSKSVMGADPLTESVVLFGRLIPINALGSASRTDPITSVPVLEVER